MFQAALLPVLALPLLAAQLPARTSDELAALIPRDSALVILFGDLADASRGDSSRWGQVLGDPRWSDVLDAMVAASPEADADEVRAVAAALGGLAGRVHGGAVGFSDVGQGALLGAFVADEGWLDSLRATLTEQGAEVSDFELDGHTGLRLMTDGDARLYGVQRGDHVLLSQGPGHEVAVESLRGALAQLAAPADVASGWWNRVPDRVPGALLEVFADIGEVTEPDPEVERVFGVFGPAYAGMMIGEGDEAELAFHIGYSGGPLIERVAQVFADADTSLLGLAPEGTTATVLAVEVNALIEGVLELAQLENPDVIEQYEAGLEAAEGMLGVDLQAALIDNLTGQLLMLQPKVDVDLLVHMDPDSPPVAGVLPVFALQLDDDDLLLDAVEVIVETAEGQGLALESAEVGGATLWSFDPGNGVSIGVAVGAGFLTLGVEQDVATFLTGLADAALPRALSPEDLAPLAAELDGALVTGARMEEVLEALESLAAQAPALAALEGEELDPAVSEWLSGAAEIMRDHLGGTLGGSMHVRATQLTYRLICR